MHLIKVDAKIPSYKKFKIRKKPGYSTYYEIYEYPSLIRMRNYIFVTSIRSGDYWYGFYDTEIGNYWSRWQHDSYAAIISAQLVPMKIQIDFEEGLTAIQNNKNLFYVTSTEPITPISHPELFI